MIIKMLVLMLLNMVVKLIGKLHENKVIKVHQKLNTKM